MYIYTYIPTNIYVNKEYYYSLHPKRSQTTQKAGHAAVREHFKTPIAILSGKLITQPGSSVSSPEPHEAAILWLPPLFLNS